MGTKMTCAPGSPVAGRRACRSRRARNSALKVSMSERPEAPRRCAVCGKPEAHDYRPFCSKRCADIDLGRWLKGNYVIPGRDIDEGDRPASPVPSQSEGSDTK